MRLARLQAEGAVRVAVADGPEWVEIDLTWPAALAASGQVAGLLDAASGRRWAPEQVMILAPVEETSRGMFCIGMNYRAHVQETTGSLGPNAKRPAVFLKLASSIIGPDESFPTDGRVSKEFDWEVELGVVIGRGGRSIPVNRVHEHIAGYTIVNDVTARDLQRDHVQWFMGKNVEGSTPVGPWVVTSDEIAFPPALAISLSVNGVEKQRSRTDQLVCSVADFVSMVSNCIPLVSGDVFATGTPAGVGFSRHPPEFLHHGDKVRAEIEGIGVLTNVVR